MKTGKILSLFTACAVVATIGASYAMWDNDSATKTASLTIGEAMNVTMTEIAFTDSKPLVPADSIGANVSTNATSLTSDLTVTVPATLIDNTELTLTAGNFKTTGDSGLEAMDPKAAAAMKVEFKEGDTALTDGKDATVTASNAYKVVVSIDSAKIAAEDLQTVVDNIAGKAISFDVTATAAAKTPVA